jgi:hypothetical protein
MAERFKAAVLKIVDRKVRGFESLSLRHILPQGWKSSPPFLVSPFTPPCLAYLEFIPAFLDLILPVEAEKIV